MAERAAHDGNDAGSTPAKPTGFFAENSPGKIKKYLLVNKTKMSSFKNNESYNNFKIRYSLKKQKIVIIALSPKSKKECWSSVETDLIKLGLTSWKITNLTTKILLSKTKLASSSSIFSGPVMLLQPTELSGVKKIEDINSGKLSVAGVLLKNRIYPYYLIKKAGLLSYGLKSNFFWFSAATALRVVPRSTFIAKIRFRSRNNVI